MLNTLIKYTIALLAGLTTLGALLVIVHIAIQPEGPAWWIGSRLGVAALVVAVGVLTGLYLRATEQPGARTALLLLGALGLLVFGAAGAVWTLHLAAVTGDLEAWAVMINLLMIGQGTLTVWRLWTERPGVSLA